MNKMNMYFIYLLPFMVNKDYHILLIGGAALYSCSMVNTAPHVRFSAADAAGGAETCGAELSSAGLSGAETFSAGS